MKFLNFGCSYMVAHDLIPVHPSEFTYIPNVVPENISLVFRICCMPIRSLLVQSHQWKHQSNVSNLFKVNNKVTRKTLLTSFRCRYCWLWKHFTHFSRVSIVNFQQVSLVSIKKLTKLDFGKIFFFAQFCLKGPSLKIEFF